MGKFEFKWSHPATTVFVTGTFDDWSKSVKLERDGNLFRRTVELPSSEKRIFYKFVVDGTWTTDHTAPQETDAANNVNNVLLPEQISRHSSDEPAKEDSGRFSVNPIPASAGLGNPISLQPGQKVPDSQETTTNAISKNVTLDKASYDNAGSNSIGETDNGPTVHSGGFFGVPPVGTGVIPESSLPMSSDATKSMGTKAPFIQSGGAGSSTAELAANVPMEPRGVPSVVSASQNEARVESEASHSPTMVKEKAETERELQSKVSPQAGISSSPSLTSTDGVAVPRIVQESISRSHQAPEATVNPSAVNEKANVEAELEQRVRETDRMGKPAPSSATDAAQLTAIPGSASNAVSDSAPNMGKDSDRGMTTAASPAMTPASASQTAQTQETANAQALKSTATPAESRDISPLSHPKKRQSMAQPVVTTGVASANTPSISKGPRSASAQPLSSTTQPAVTTGLASAEIPSSSTGAEASSNAPLRTLRSASSSKVGEKKSKRGSMFFTKIKEKLKH